MQKLNVLYEDNHIIVVEKIINIPSQADKTGDIDMLTIVKEYLKEKYNKKGDAYVGLVHRLDRPTGGIMVFAKTSKAASRLSEQIRNKEFKKCYLCIVDGKLEQEEGTFRDYLIKDERKNISRVAKTSKDKKNAKEAILDYRVLKYNNEINLSVVEVELKTGRHHQIRVQFSSRNHSLYGDQKYGVRGRGKQLTLWANKIVFKHPVTKEEMIFALNPPHEASWKILD